MRLYCDGFPLKPRQPIYEQLSPGDEIEVRIPHSYESPMMSIGSHSRLSLMDTNSDFSEGSGSSEASKVVHHAVSSLRQELEQLKLKVPQDASPKREDSHPLMKRKDEPFEQTLGRTVASLSARLDNLDDKIDSKNLNFETAMKELRILTASLRGMGGMSPLPLQVGQSPSAESLPVLKCKGTIEGHQGPVWALAVGNGLLFSASSDNTVKVWDLTTFKLRSTLAGHTSIVHAVICWNDLVISGSDDRTIKLWNTESFKCIKTISDDNIACVLKVSNSYLFSGSYKCVKVWSLEKFSCAKVLQGHNHWVRAICISNGYLYTGSYNVIKIWDLATFKCWKTLNYACGSIYSLLVSGHLLLSGTYENSINVWDLRSYDCIRTIPGHTGAVYSLAVSGNRLFSGSYDNSIRVWDMTTYQCTQRCVGHSSSVEALVMADGLLFSGSTDSTIKFWR
eukprot:TRINITY_DN9397_c0_g2_i3.p1 TRINITY_DN9397_c0_g2~~TRINITY_DN9397_c0_g2_i3.p1  ORF type:complete len:451 (+),score=42.47 TRINITY_DN9397_c0_g2_i3:445-1797(+)